MPARVLIHHLSGSKSNQIEEFPADHLDELVLGRDRGAAIVFDAPGEDVVSRRHAAIRRRRAGSGDAGGQYEIVDLGSSNGTFVNGRLITGAGELQPGDTIELGRGGPRLSFDLEPRPAAMARTRIVQPGEAGAAAGGAGAAPETRVVAAVADAGAPGGGSAAPARAAAGEPPAKQAVGRETVARMLSDERHATSRLWIYSAAAAVVLMAIGAGVLYWNSRQGEAQIVQQFAKAQSTAEQRVKDTLAKMGMTPGDIAAKYTDATVLVHVKWRLYDKNTGKPVFQKTLKGKEDGKLYPVYVAVGDHTVVRWLTLDDEDATNLAIGFGASGSGFVVNKQGFILTNHHVAASWMVPYDDDPLAIIAVPDPKEKKFILRLADPRPYLKTWIPANGGLLFDGRLPVEIEKADFEGRNDDLDVHFPNSITVLPARLLRASQSADVALIKVDSLQNLRPVQLAPDSNVNVGDRLIVLGYPANHNQVLVESTNIEAGRISTATEMIPKPTLTEGVAARITGGLQHGQDGTITHAALGDIIEMTISASGHGNSGGPVFNSAGQVVGLFTYGLEVGDSGVANESGAVPIKYARQLLQME